jgi:hypothetical protein
LEDEKIEVEKNLDKKPKKRKSAWDKLKEDEKQLRQMVINYWMRWGETTPKEDEQLMAGKLETCCDYHVKNFKGKFKPGTIIIVVSGSNCPYCDVATLGIYSKD